MSETDRWRAEIDQAHDRLEAELGDRTDTIAQWQRLSIAMHRFAWEFMFSLRVPHLVIWLNERINTR